MEKKKETEVAKPKNSEKKSTKKVTPKPKAESTAKKTGAEEKKTVKKKSAEIKKKLKITVPYSEIESSINELAEKYSGDIKLSGFRKGKVPSDLLKSRYKSAISDEALNKIVEQYIFKEIDKKKLKIASQPVVEKMDYKEGEDLKADVTVEVFPEIELPDLETFVVKMPKDELKVKAYSEKEQLDRILESRKRLVNVADRDIKDGDFVVINLQNRILRTKRLSPRKEEYFVVKDDQEFYVKDLYKELIGKKTGDQFSIKRAYPKNYSKKVWAGEKVEHMIEISRTQEYFTPELDKSLVEELGFKSVDEFKKKIKTDFEDFSKHQMEEKKNGKIVEALIESIDFKVPESMVEQEAGRLKNMNMQQGIPVSDEKELKKRALDSVKFSLIHFEIQKKYDIDASNDDIETELKSMADKHQMPIKEIRKYYSNPQQKEQLKDKIKGDKVIKLLSEKIKFEEI